MKHLLPLLVVGVFFCTVAYGQQPDDLTVTLPTGRVVTFKTAEQKARFEAARSAAAAKSAETAKAEHAKAQDSVNQMASAGMNHTALDSKPAQSGVVNVSAPPFTADYYMLAPETWIGKPVTLSVAYLTPSTEGERKDGMRKLEAATWGTKPGVVDQHSGGDFTILTTPEIAMRLLQQCGTHLQYMGWTYKTTLIHGEFTAFEPTKGSSTSTKAYGLTITK